MTLSWILELQPGFLELLASVLHGGVKWEWTGGSGGDGFPRVEGETDVRTRSLGSVQSEVTLAASARRLCSILYSFHPSYGADGHS